MNLGTLAEIAVGFAFPSGEFVKGGDGPRLVRGDNIAHGQLRWGEATTWRWPNPVPDQRYVLEPGDLVLGMDRPWIASGIKYAVVSFDEAASLLVQRVARLRARSPIPQRFLRYVVSDQRYADYIQSVQTGTSIPHISASQILAYPVPLDGIEHAHAIAEVLGALDDKIAANARVSGVVSALMIAVGSLLTGTATPVPLGEVADSAKRQIQPAAMGAVAHFSLPAFDQGELPAMDSGDSIMSNKLSIERPCVLLSRLNPRIPRLWEIPALPDRPAVASTEFVVLEPREVSTAALWSTLSQPSAISRLQELARGTSGSHQRVRPEEAMSLTIADPRQFSAEQAELLGGLGARRQAAKQESRHLAELRDTLLPHLMSGRLTVRDAEKQVEEVL